MNTTYPVNRCFAEHVSRLPTTHQKPQISGTIRQHYADFQVTEFLSFEPCGEGEHLFLFIEKQNCNTQWVADELQKHFKIRSQDIGYAGKKDKVSVARQWFSLHLPGKKNILDEAQIQALNNEYFHVVTVTRHNKKLRKGVIKSNHFQITVRELSGKLEPEVLNRIASQGFPNYYGYQRFGSGGSNLTNAEKLFSQQIRVRSRNKRGLYLSAARSYLFNLILAKRVEMNHWNTALDGDCLSLAGSQSYFVCEQVDQQISQRLCDADLHVSGLLVGEQDSEAKSIAKEIEDQILNDHINWLEGIKREKLRTARRPMRVIPEGLQLQYLAPSEAILQFSLPAGSFATSLLRELVVIKDAAVTADSSSDQI